MVIGVPREIKNNEFRVGNAHQLQEKLAYVATDWMESPLRPGSSAPC